MPSGRWHRYPESALEISRTLRVAPVCLCTSAQRTCTPGEAEPLFHVGRRVRECLDVKCPCFAPAEYRQELNRRSPYRQPAARLHARAAAMAVAEDIAAELGCSGDAFVQHAPAATVADLVSPYTLLACRDRLARRMHTSP